MEPLSTLAFLDNHVLLHLHKTRRDLNLGGERFQSRVTCEHGYTTKMAAEQSQQQQPAAAPLRDPPVMNFAAAAKREVIEKDLKCVQLTGLVVLKIVKHCNGCLPSLVTGQLLGLDVGSTLEVTDCFPFPVGALRVLAYEPS